MADKNNTGIIIVIIAIVAIGFFTMQQKEAKTISGEIIGGLVDLKVQFFDSDGQIVTADSSLQSIFRVNDVEDVLSMTITGKVCATKPLYAILEGTSSVGVINEEIKNADSTQGIFNTNPYYVPPRRITDGDGNKIISLVTGECSEFTTNLIDLDSVGEGSHKLSMKAEAYLSLGSCVGSGGRGCLRYGLEDKLDEKNSNIITLNIERIVGGLGDITISYG